MAILGTGVEVMSDYNPKEISKKNMYPSKHPVTEHVTGGLTEGSPKRNITRRSGGGRGAMFGLIYGSQL